MAGVSASMFGKHSSTGKNRGIGDRAGNSGDDCNGGVGIGETSVTSVTGEDALGGLEDGVRRYVGNGSSSSLGKFIGGLSGESPKFWSRR